MIPFIQSSKIEKIIYGKIKKSKKKLVLLGTREKGEWRVIASGYEVSLGR